MKSLLKETIVTVLILMSLVRSSAQVSVTATGGTPTGSYATLNAAFAAINAGTHQGAINISITGNTTEPSPPTSLVGSGVGSASYTSIYISPSGGSWTVNSSTVPFAYRGIIELFGAQHVTIDGDPTGTGARHLTFAMIQTSNLSVSTIRFGSTDNTGLHGAANDTVRNCNIIGGRDSINTTATEYGILFSGSSISSVTTPVAYGCSHNTFLNNTFSRCYYAIYMSGIGNDTLEGNSNTLIRKNYFLGSTADTSNNYGVYMAGFNTAQYSSACIIDSNDFTATGYFTFSCMYITSGMGTLTIDNNNIHDVNGSSIDGLYLLATGGFFNTTPVYAPLNIYNNIWQNSTGGGNLLTVNGNATGKWDMYGNTIDNIATTVSGASFTGFSINNVQTDSTFFHNNMITNISSASNIGIVTYSGKIYDNVISGLAAIVGYSSSYGIQANGTGEIYNNMISDITAVVQDSNLSNSASSMGIMVNNSANVKLYANTIALNTTNQPGTFANAISYAVYCQGLGVFHNNIIYNSQNSPNAYGFFNAAPSSFFTRDTLDYNEYYVPYGNIGYTGAAPEVNLLDWQAATGVQDLHSVSGPVPFVSTTNLHIDTLNADANNVFRNGTYITSVLTDIDGQTRNNPPCIGADEFYAVDPLPDSLVWPGDADNNRVVDNNDLLPIGLGYDSTGPVRAVTGIVWQGDLATNWANYFSVYLPTVNFNHADCNGDGTINAADTSAIAANFGDIHSKTNNLPGQSRNGTPSLTLSFYPDTIYNNDTLTTTLYLGTQSMPVNNIYGLAFTFNYDPLVIDSDYSVFSFISSWLGTSANSININRNFSSGQVKAAITGIDHVARSGNGAIATFRAVITTDNINGKTYSYYTNRQYISDINAIDQYGNPVALNAGIDSNYVGFFLNGINTIDKPLTVDVYPNPAGNQVMIKAGLSMNEATISDMLGQQVLIQQMNGKQTATLDISTLAKGVYTVHISTQRGIATARLVVSR